MIRTAFIYKKAVAEPIGESIIHNGTVAFASARKPIAQVFKPVGASDDKKFIAIANHFKSKGSAATPDDNDKGQGASNLARTPQAKSLLAFSDELQKSKGTDKVFLIGDFNSYAKEDPLNVLTGAGYVNQEKRPRTPTVPPSTPTSFGGLVGLPRPRPRLPRCQRRRHRRGHLGHQLRRIRGARVQPLQQQRHRLLRSGPVPGERPRSVVVGLNLPVTRPVLS